MSTMVWVRPFASAIAVHTSSTAFGLCSERKTRSAARATSAIDVQAFNPFATRRSTGSRFRSVP